MKCRSNCRMGAIRDDLSYAQGECILSMDCVYDCPAQGTRFSLRRPSVPAQKEGAISRRDFLMLAAASFLSSSGIAAAAQQEARRRKARVIRPPASLEEGEFVNRCIRCGICMKVCVTNGLQPALFESGASGIWTPRLVPEIGYCEYHCTLCGRVCPTGAIPRLTEKQKLAVRLGIAWFDRSRCLPWKENKPCLVCEEHCPVAPKAIRLKTVKPGEYLIGHYTDVLQALSLAGGLTPFAAENDIKLIRRVRGQQQVFPVRYGDLRKGQELEQNILLQRGDTVMVP